MSMGYPDCKPVAKDLLGMSDYQLEAMRKDDLLEVVFRLRKELMRSMEKKLELENERHWYEGVARENKNYRWFIKSVLEQYRLSNSNLIRVSDGEVADLQQLIKEQEQYNST